MTKKRQCQHRSPARGTRRYGRQCRRKAITHAYNKSSEGGIDVCGGCANRLAAPGVGFRALD